MVKRIIFYVLVHYAVVCAYGLGSRMLHYPNLDVGWILTGKRSRS